MKKQNLVAVVTAILLVLLVDGCKKEPVITVDSFDGVTISFDNKGSGEPAIILVHGWSNTRAIWDAQVKYFSKLYQVIAVDLPGFGKSGNNRTDWSIASFGRDISAIIRQLDLKEVVLVGFSMGAPVVIEAAAKSPGHVIGVVLVDDLQDVEMQYPPQVVPSIDSFMMDLVTFPTKEKLVDNGFIRKNVDSATMRIVSMLDGASHVGWSESIAGYIKWRNDDCTRTIQAVKAPIVAINSDMEPTNVEAFRKYAPTFRVNIVSDVAHVIKWDNTEEFNRLLEDCILEFTGK
jgi:pimeloyl-ACP methyl ester carboxylesterase